MTVSTQISKGFQLAGSVRKKNQKYAILDGDGKGIYLFNSADVWVLV